MFAPLYKIFLSVIPLIISLPCENSIRYDNSKPVHKFHFIITNSSQCRSPVNIKVCVDDSLIINKKIAYEFHTHEHKYTFNIEEGTHKFSLSAAETKTDTLITVIGETWSALIYYYSDQLPESPDNPKLAFITDNEPILFQ